MTPRPSRDRDARADDDADRGRRDDKIPQAAPKPPRPKTLQAVCRPATALRRHGCWVFSASIGIPLDEVETVAAALQAAGVVAAAMSVNESVTDAEVVP